MGTANSLRQNQDERQVEGVLADLSTADMLIAASILLTANSQNSA